MPEKGPSGNREFVWQAEVTEVKSETVCRECNQGLVPGNMFVEDQRNQNKYHIGCGAGVAAKNPIAAVYLRKKAWPAAGPNYGRR